MDNDFASELLLLQFRRDLMVMARDQFSEEYGMYKKILGAGYTLSVQKQWNQSLWMEIATTVIFLRLVREQMDTKSRVKDDVVSMIFLFGRSKVGIAFKDHMEMNNYVFCNFRN